MEIVLYGVKSAWTEEKVQGPKSSGQCQKKFMAQKRIKKKKVKINSKGITKFIYIYHCRDKHSAGKI